jgi:hypothetical protein
MNLGVFSRGYQDEFKPKCEHQNEKMKDEEDGRKSD